MPQPNATSSNTHPTKFFISFMKGGCVEGARDEESQNKHLVLVYVIYLLQIT